MRTASERRELLKAVYEEARGCTRCPLHQTRTTVVFGAGNADADLMFIGEAPGANEDRIGLPFVGQAGKLLDKLLGEIGLERGDVFIANTLKCRPPNNRDPQPNEIEACNDYLRQQVDLIEPTVICTLGNFSTKLLRADSAGISRLHGREEVRIIGPRAVRLYPLYHPAAALYTPSMLEALRADFYRIPDLLALGPPEQPRGPSQYPIWRIWPTTRTRIGSRSSGSPSRRLSSGCSSAPRTLGTWRPDELDLGRDVAAGLLGNR